MKDFEVVYETGGTFPDYLMCVHCGERVDRGIVNVSHHWLHCLKRPEGLIVANNEFERKMFDSMSFNLSVFAITKEVQRVEDEMHKLCGIPSELLSKIQEARFLLSIRKAEDCLFGRREGIIGKIIFGYSIRLRLFNHDLI